jgi:hypothetical protein
MRVMRVWYPGPFDLNQSTTSQSIRNVSRCFRGRFQRDPAGGSGSASPKSSSSTEAKMRPTLFPRGRAFFRRVFFALDVTPLL